jgi:hypothetical protein
MKEKIAVSSKVVFSTAVSLRNHTRAARKQLNIKMRSI